MLNCQLSRWGVGLAAVLAFVALVEPALAAQPTPWQLGFQPAAAPVMEKIHEFHTFILVIITVITLFVLALLIWVLLKFNKTANPNPSKVSHNTMLEVAWTVVPIIILLIIAVPSFRLLYFEQEIPEADLTIKAIGYQWYWGYEYPDHGDISFEQFMLADDEARQARADASGASIDDYPRLLAVDQDVVVPVGKTIRVIVTAADVLHNLAMPAFGIKIDAVPGRLNETWFRADREGIFYGQCSELCGVNHAFMPIAIRVVSEEQFNQWAELAQDDLDAANQQLATVLREQRQLARDTRTRETAGLLPAADAPVGN